MKQLNVHQHKDDRYRLDYLNCLFLKLYNFFHKTLILISTTAVVCITLSTPVIANPQGGVVAAGGATIQQTPGSTVINQTTGKAIINWQSFNIGASELTHFQQPNGGIALNRINPTQGVSQIYGRLTATGQIILINPAGIFFGPGSFVNVGGLIATTSNLSDQDFLSGNYHFTRDLNYSGSIINEGTIIAADHGLIALVGNNVQNNGVIEANLGQVVLASGSAFTMNFDGTNLINFTIDEKAVGEKTGVSNRERVTANGGKILVTAKSAQNVLDNVINMEGVLEAKSVGVKNGEIILLGDEGVVNVSGKVIASGKNVGEKGGRVKILGKKVALTSKAEVDVSGDTGGGEILIGGDFQGKNPEVMNADRTFFGSEATAKADAITSGNGGKVIVWANNDTDFLW